MKEGTLFLPKVRKPNKAFVYCGGVIKTTAQIEYYTALEEIERVFQKVADPIAFACQVS